MESENDVKIVLIYKILKNIYLNKKETATTG